MCVCLRFGFWALQIDIDCMTHCREHQQHLPFDGASRTASLHASPMSEATSTETGHCFAEKRGMRCFRDGAGG
jgi:hypothetical protein